MTTYYISVDLDQAGIEAKSEEEALKKAEKLIKEGCYSLNIVDKDEDDTQEPDEQLNALLDSNKKFADKSEVKNE